MERERLPTPANTPDEHRALEPDDADAPAQFAPRHSVISLGSVEEQLGGIPGSAGQIFTGKGWRIGAPTRGLKYARDPDGLMAWRTLVLLFMNTVALVLYVLAFSAMGYGFSVFDTFSDSFDLSVSVVGTSSLVFLLLYLLDFSYWPKSVKWLKYFFILAILVGFSVGAVLGASKYPQAPVTVFLLLTPGYIYVVKRILFYHVMIPNFLECMSHSLLLCAVGLAVYWVYWFAVGSGDFWDQRTKELYSSKIDSCKLPLYPAGITVAKRTQINDAHDWCETGFLIWIAPMILAMGCFVFGMICRFVSLRMFNFGGKNIQLKVFVGMLFFCVLGMWVAASVAGGGMAISNLVNSFTFVAMILTGIVLTASVGFKSLKQHVMNSQVVNSANSIAQSEWFKGIILLVASPVLVFYVALSFLNQQVRSYILSNWITKEMSADEKKLWVTQVCANQIEAVKRWHWTSVMHKAIYLGLFFMLIQVGVGKGTYLFLSWLNETLSTFSLGAVTTIFYAVGLGMFLLPPVPGVPVYLAGGVILTASAWKGGSGDMSYVAALFYSSLVCFLVKLNAIVVQQKGFGERLSNNKVVKTLVGVNSVPIRAIEFILKQKGISTPKVFILIGGPDWPVSVLTGILKLNVFQMLLGSLPVIFLIVPCVLAGAFMLKENPADPGDIWPSVLGVTLVLAAGIQTFAFAGCMYHIDKISHTHREELMRKPLDQDVREVEERNKATNEAYMKATNWNVVPCLLKFVLFTSFVAIVLCFYMVNLVPKRCFAEFGVTQKISSLKANGEGKWWHVVRNPWGYGCIALLLCSCVCLFIFSRWARSATRKEMARTRMPSSEPKESIRVDT